MGKLMRRLSDKDNMEENYELSMIQKLRYPKMKEKKPTEKTSKGSNAKGLAHEHFGLCVHPDVAYTNTTEEKKREVTKLFKKWFVRRPNGNCQVLFALTELDDFIDEIDAVYGKTISNEIKREAKIEMTKKYIKDIEDYRVPMGFGSASGGIGISAVKDYLKQSLSKLTQQSLDGGDGE